MCGRGPGHAADGRGAEHTSKQDDTKVTRLTGPPRGKSSQCDSLEECQSQNSTNIHVCVCTRTVQVSVRDPVC